MNYKFLILLLSLILIVCAFRPSVHAENFNDFTDYILKENPKEIYDEFYSNIYNKLFENTSNPSAEIKNLIYETVDNSKRFKKDKIKILDLGCGTGKHLHFLKKYKLKCAGVDNSKKMLEKAEIENRSAQLVHGDFNKQSIFKNREFSHIFCLFMTVYYAQDLEKLLKNANYWLKRKGYFCVHLVEKTPHFKPIKKSFGDFNYSSTLENNKEESLFEENFLFKNKSKFVKNKHHLKIRKPSYYKFLAKKHGFSYIKRIDLPSNIFGKNFIYIFEKKYGK